MRLNVAAELKFPERAGHVSLLEEAKDIEYNQSTVGFAAPIEVELDYSFDGTGFQLDGTVKTAVKAECARCTKELVVPFEQDFSERFEKAAGEDSDVYLFSGEELDLSDLIRDVILLNIDTYVLCKEDCRGLCPVCGCDLNTVQCSCEQKTDENPFSALKALFNEDKEV